MKLEKNKHRQDFSHGGSGQDGNNIPLLYVLHSGNLYGTERMALATITGMSTTYSPLLLAPPGPIHAEAQRQGVLSYPFTSGRDLAAYLHRLFTTSRRLA